MVEDKMEAPPGGGRDRAMEGQSPGSEDEAQNKPNGHDPQGFDAGKAPQRSPFRGSGMPRFG